MAIPDLGEAGSGPVLSRDVHLARNGCIMLLRRDLGTTQMNQICTLFGGFPRPAYERSSENTSTTHSGE